jgi:exopolyphosphatase/guanosine-5'-triphosphate,3'-diphosphate pyrophosphatase
MNLAAIDIGTNAARLLIARVERKKGCIQLQKLAYYRVPLRLGEDVFEKGKITAKKTLHFQQTIQAFQLLASTHDVFKLRAVATSAMREASNGKKVAKQISQQTGVVIDIISGDEEAQLIFNSFELLQLQKQQQFVVLDVGGGSTEISIFEHGQKVAARSFELGTIRILKGRVDTSTWSDFKSWIQNNVQLDQAHVIFGTGGNINRALKMLDNTQKDTLQLKEIKQLLAKLLDLTLEQRCEKFKLKPDRADVIVPALQIYITALEALGQDNLVVPKIGLSDGVIYQLFLQNSQI